MSEIPGRRGKSQRESEPAYPSLGELEGGGEIAGIRGTGRWLVFQYEPTSLFSLKASYATSTVGKTLVGPTPYAAKMAFVDVALRHGLTDEAAALVRWLADSQVRIGLPVEACVTTTIQRVRQETRPEDRKKDPAAPPYRTTIAMREIVHYLGQLALAFDLSTCAIELIQLLAKAAPAINYLGKRGSFIQYRGQERRRTLDDSFTQPFDSAADIPAEYQLATMDDFGSRASFEALNTFSGTAMKRDVDRTFVSTAVPLALWNQGFGFAHYVRADRLAAKTSV